MAKCVLHMTILQAGSLNQPIMVDAESHMALWYKTIEENTDHLTPFLTVFKLNLQTHYLIYVG